MSHSASNGAFVRSAWLAITLLPLVKALRIKFREQLSDVLNNCRSWMQTSTDNACPWTLHTSRKVTSSVHPASMFVL